MPSIDSPQYEAKRLIEEYELKQYVEVGVDKGVSLSFALSYGLSPVLGCDINAEHVAYCRLHTGLIGATIFHLDSVSFLKMILPDLKGRTLFFCDAHDPGFWKEAAPEEMQWPLYLELEAIKAHKKDFYRDVIIADDWKSYSQWGKATRPIEDYLSIFSDTHEYRVEDFDTGGLIFTPRV